MPTPSVSSFPVSKSRFGNKAQFGFFVLLFVAVTLFLQHCTGGFAADRGNHADEAAHYVSSIAIADYLASGLGSRPVAFFIDYYAHFPKVAIGHWPPFFEFLQAIVILLFGANAFTALGLQAAIAGATAAVAAAVTSRLFGVVAGLTAGLAVLLSPVFLAIPDEVMADTLGALTVAAATVCWSVFLQERSWRSCCLFAVTATLSILTKGTGLGLALMPLIDAALRRDAAFLLHPKTLAAAALVAMLTAPWYLLTYRMAADGFVYTWGWHYTRLAVPFFLRGLIGAVGLPCSLLYGYGVVRCWASVGQAHCRHASGHFGLCGIVAGDAAFCDAGSGRSRCALSHSGPAGRGDRGVCGVLPRPRKCSMAPVRKPGSHAPFRCWSFLLQRSCWHGCRIRCRSIRTCWCATSWRRANRTC